MRRSQAQHRPHFLQKSLIFPFATIFRQPNIVMRGFSFKQETHCRRLVTAAEFSLRGVGRLSLKAMITLSI
jgi:hypothetical protein